MILLRHAQSHFNLHFGKTRKDPGIEDPELTDEGIEQARAAAQRLAGTGIGHILCSPYTRTLQTASILSEALALPIEIEPLIREQAYFSCDIGTARSELEARYSGLDFSALEEVWWSPGPESAANLQQRCERFTAKISTAPNLEKTLVVSHWAFIQGLTGQGLKNGQHLKFDPRRR